MKKLILILTLLFSISVFSQSDKILLDYDINTHKDSLSTSTVNEFINMAEHSQIDYEKYIEDIKEVRSIEADRNFVNSLDDGVIILNKRLDEFPYTKRVAILQMLFVNNGGRLLNKKGASILFYFSVTNTNEGKFKKQKSYRSTLNKIETILEEEKPLRRKKW